MIPEGIKKKIKEFEEIIDACIKSKEFRQEIDRLNSVVNDLSERISNTQRIHPINNKKIVDENDVKTLFQKWSETKNNDTSRAFSNEIYEMKTEFEREKETNKLLSERIQKQDNEITLLKSKLDNIQIQIECLRTQETQETQETSLSLYNNLFFDDNIDENKTKLMELLQQTHELQNTTRVAVTNQEDGCLKLIANLQEKLEKLIEKNNKQNYAADKLAYEMTKILKQTIIKGLTQKNMKNVFAHSLDKMRIRRLEWNVGKILSNDDYEYLEEPIMYKAVGNLGDANKIMEILQDTYIIDYIEDDNKYEAIIPGIYRLGCYNRR